MYKFYAYKGCDSCRKARKWLDANQIPYQEIAIREQTPSMQELGQASAKLGIKALFNTSGVDYREQGMKNLLPDMSESEALSTLSDNGNLVKRPFLINSNTSLVGFKQALWKETLS